MKPTSILSAILFFVMMAFASFTSGQAVTTLSQLTLSNGSSTILNLTRPVGGNTIVLPLTTESVSGFSGNNRTWQATPNNSGRSITVSGTNNYAANVTFNANTAVSQFTTLTYTVTVQAGTASATVTVNLYPSNFWAAFSQDGTSTYETRAFTISGGVVSSGTNYTTLFTTGTAFAAVGRSEYPDPSGGWYYWIPNQTNNGQFTLYARAGDGTGSNIAVATADLNGASNTSLGFVRLGLSKKYPDGSSDAWILAGDGTQLYLAKALVKEGVATTVTVVDANVALQLPDGTPESAAIFQNGDLCLDGNGTIYALANSSGTTEVYIGAPNGTNTVLVKKWSLLNSTGGNFGGSVNGVCFDAAGGVYFSTTDGGTTNDGIYYLQPSTVIAAQNSSTLSTINSTRIFAASGYTDLGTNVWPYETTLPVQFGNVQSTYNNGSIEVSWQTATENGNKYFAIEASADGKEFHQVAKVDSKAVNGISATTLNYSYTVDTHKLSALMGSLLMVVFAFCTSFSKRRTGKWIGVLAVGLATLLVVSCNKNNDDVVDRSSGEKVYIRIAQYDTNDKLSGYSKVVTVIKP